MSATALSSNEEARQFWRFILILCVVYAVLLLCIQYLGNLWIERERARFFDLG